MKIVQMNGNTVHWITPYVAWSEVPEFAPDIIFKEAPDYVEEGWTVSPDGVFSRHAKELAFPDTTFQSVQAKLLILEHFGVNVLTPEDTRILAIEANLPPIADGQEWQPGLNLVEGTIVTQEGEHFVVAPKMGHIATTEWSPRVAQNLFEQIDEPFADWSQPDSWLDAYMSGDKVLHDKQVWESTASFNMHAPGEHGWETEMKPKIKKK